MKWVGKLRSQEDGVDRTNITIHRIKILFKLLNRVKNYWLVDGWIERAVGLRIRGYINETMIFLDVGCGDMKLEKYLPPNIIYNAFDLRVDLGTSIARKKRSNVIQADATSMPIKDNNVDMLVSTEVLEHIPKYDIAINEIYRVCKNNAIVIISIPNNYCHKYDKKGPHPDHCNNWTYEGFIDLMNDKNFKLLEGRMLGWWLPILRKSPTSIMFPFESITEYKNCNFIFVFRVKKRTYLDSRLLGGI
jgi:SAM-dependent methyltransferase